MKKVISLLLCAVMLFGCVSAACFTSSAAKAYTVGDVDGSGSLNALDALKLRRQVAEAEPVSDFDAADVNADMTVNSKDLLYLRRALAYIIDLEEINPTPEFGTVGRIRIGPMNARHYGIVVTNEENPNMVFAAEELQKYIERATGIKLPISNEKGQYNIVLMEDATTDSALGDDGFALTVTDAELTIMGGARRGCMYGVYELLEDYFGYRFFGYGDVYLADVGTVDVPEGLVDTQIPDTSYRAITIDPYESQYVESSTVKRKLNGSMGGLNNEKYGYSIERFISNAHSFDQFIPSNYVSPCLSKWLPDGEDYEFYFTDAFWDNCEDFVGQSPFDECIVTMSQKLDERIAWGQTIGKEITEISCSYHWEEKFCSCINCRIIYREEGSYAGVLVEFVNRVSDVIQARYPGIRFITNAYGEVRIPPKTKVLNDDIILLYCWNGCANHPIGSGGCGENTNSLGNSNTIQEEYYLGWLEHCSQTYIWYYPTNIYYTLAPLANVFYIYEEFQWLIEHGAVGFYVVGTAGDAFDGLTSYLMSEMLWDKDISYEEYCQLIKDYMAYYYGEGWENIYRYAEMMGESQDLQGCFMNDFDHPLTMYNAEYQIAHFDEQVALFDAALAATDDERQKENIIRASAHMYFLYYASAYESKYVNGSAAEREAYAEGWLACYDLINEYDIRVTYQRRGISASFTLDKSPMQLVYNTD